jgi:hypothetical protein
VLRRTLRIVTPLVFVATLGLLPLLAWLDLGVGPIAVGNSAKGLRSVTWAGAIGDEGRLSIAITYDTGDDITRDLDVRVPPGGRLLTVDGEAVAADIGRYASVRVTSKATVRFELPGAVTRYRDGAIVALAGVTNDSIDSDRMLFPCAICSLDEVTYGDLPIYGRLFVDGADDIDLHFLEMTSIRSEADPDGGSVRFVGIDPGGTGVSMVAVLHSRDSDALDTLPMGDGSVDDAWDRLRTSIENAADTRFRGPSVPDGGNPVFAIILTALLGLPVLYFVIRALWDIGAGAATRRADVDDSAVLSATTRPDHLEPALAGLVVGDTRSGKQSVVAATLLDLARRDVIEISGDDSRRFSISVPAEARGDTKFEDAVLTSLRPLTNPKGPAEINGPPMWSGKQAAVVNKTLQSVLFAEARRAGLLRVRVSFALSVSIAFAMGVIAIIAGVGPGWALVFVGPILALLTSAAIGQGLSAKGRFARDQWSAYGTWLRTSNPQLARAGVHEVKSLGDKLVYAAALGGAPVAAESLSPTGRAKE